ncbi:MAG: outer membrane [Geobacteraceae bacterium]|nr:MAG: outer membrane [Geobacteraceae bacterium]
MRSFLVLAALLFISGCAHRGISPETMRLVDPTVSFAMLKEKPDAYVGKHVQAGGVIAGVRNTPAGGELEVVQLDLDGSGMPKDSANSGGRFLAQSDRFLDPLIFRPGLSVTLVGEVKGKKTMPLENVDYTYPLLAVRELYLWKPEDVYQLGTALHFGFGVFKGF